MSRPSACLICGSESAVVTVSLVEWAEPIDGRRWESLPRCIDRQACRERLELLGERWPIRDSVTIPSPAAVPEPEPVVLAPDVESASADEDEGVWL